jgi:hypothetical protein
LLALTDRIVEAEAVEVPVDDRDDLGEVAVRTLPERRSGAELDSWRGEIRAIAVVAAGGLAAGAATVVALSAARSRSNSRNRPVRRIRREGDGIVASRSFLVDVHVLGR